MNRESVVIPKLVNSQNFKIKKPKIINPTIVFKTNSWYLNISLVIIFIVFLVFFLYNCKSGNFNSDNPEPYSLAYNLK